MKKGNESSAAKCPFYRCETTTEIYCEGVSERSIIVFRFFDGRNASRYRHSYCNSICGHHDCPIYKALGEKYAE